MIQSKPRGNAVASPAQASDARGKKGRKSRAQQPNRGATGDPEADQNNSSDNNIDDPEKNQGITEAAATFDQYDQDSNYKDDKQASSPTNSYDKKVKKAGMSMSRHTTKNIDT